MNTISKKYVVDYITREYGDFIHDADKFVKAIRYTASKFKLNKVDLFHYIIERSPSIPMTTSYGYDTAYGREIRDVFAYKYHETK